MAVSQPNPTDKLDAPSHSKLHRVVGVDLAAPDESLNIDASGNATIKAIPSIPVLATDALGKVVSGLSAADLRYGATKPLQLSGDFRALFNVKVDWRLLDLKRSVLAFPNGVTILSWYLDSSESDPTTEINANLKYCDGGDGPFPGTGVTLIDVIDSDHGKSSREDMSLSARGTGIIPPGMVIFLSFDEDPTDYNVTWLLTLNLLISPTFSSSSSSSSSSSLSSSSSSSSLSSSSSSSSSSRSSSSSSSSSSSRSSSSSSSSSRSSSSRSSSSSSSQSEEP